MDDTIPLENYGYKAPAAPAAQQDTIPLEKYGYKAPASTNIGDQIDENRNTIASKANAIYQATLQGVQDIGSSIQKAITPYTYGALKHLNPITKKLGFEARSPESVQPDYEQGVREFESNPDVKAHPYYSMAGRIIGNMAATAPLSMIPGGAAKSLAGAGAEAASTLPAVAGLFTSPVTRGAVGVLSNAAMGGVQAGITNNVGADPSSGFDPAQAKTGAIVGGVLGAVQPIVGGAIKGLAKDAAYVAKLRSWGYNGPVFSTDIPENQGMWTKTREWLTNKVLGNVPIVNKTPGIGVLSARNSQLAHVASAQQGQEEAIKKIVTSLADKYPNGSYETYKHALKISRGAVKKEIGAVSTEFKEELLKNNKIFHDLSPETTLDIETLLSGPAKISADLKPRLQAALKDGRISTEEMFGRAKEMGLKERIWKEAERLAGGVEGRTNTINYDASNDLKKLYGAVKNDIVEGIKDTPAEAAFHKFNAKVSGLHKAWDPENTSAIAKEALGFNQAQKDLYSAWNKLTGKNVDPKAIKKYGKLIGQEGRDALELGAMQNMFTASLDQTGKFNVTKFLHLAKQQNSRTASLSPETMKKIQHAQEALEGLQWMADKAAKGTDSKFGGEAAVAALGATGAAAYVEPMVAAVMAVPAALSAAVAHAPVRNALKILNNVMSLGKTDNGITNWALTRANKALTQAGVAYSVHDDGTVHFDKTNDNKE